MKFILGLLLFTFCFVDCWGQLVRKKDYDAAFAIHGGVNMNIFMPFQDTQVNFSPIGGVKMTFPFTRKWFLGNEINYKRLHYEYMNKDQLGTLIQSDLKIEQVQVPLYVKYMLNCNKACVLIGGYVSWIFNAEYTASIPLSVPKWEGGITVGYEHRILKHLNIMLKIDAGTVSLLKDKTKVMKSVYPLQIGLTLSYDFLRIGDCGCD